MRALGGRNSLRKKRALYTMNSMIVQKFLPSTTGSPLIAACSMLHPLAPTSDDRAAAQDGRHERRARRRSRRRPSRAECGPPAALRPKSSTLIGPFVVPAFPPKSSMRAVHDYIVDVQKAVRHARLPRLSKVDLHLHEPRRIHGIPRTRQRLPNRATSSTSTSPVIEEGWRRNTSRIVRRQQGCARPRSASSTSHTKRCGSASARFAPARTSATSARQSRPSSSRRHLSIVREFSGRGYRRSHTRYRRCFHYGDRGQQACSCWPASDVHGGADGQRRQAPRTACCPAGWTVVPREGQLTLSALGASPCSLLTPAFRSFSAWPSLRCKPPPRALRPAMPVTAHLRGPRAGSRRQSAVRAGITSPDCPPRSPATSPISSHLRRPHRRRPAPQAAFRSRRAGRRLVRDRARLVTRCSRPHGRCISASTCASSR